MFLFSLLWDATCSFILDLLDRYSNFELCGLCLLDLPWILDLDNIMVL